MKTDALIDALAVDHAVPPPPLARGLAFGIAAGGSIAVILYLILLGPRPDVDTALHSARFLFKFVFAMSLASSAGVVVMRLLRPGVPSSLRLLMIAPALLAAAVVLEMLALPRDTWVTNMFGTTWRVCIAAIPMLSFGPLVALLVALRRGAPTSPGAAGAVVGLLAGGLGAFIYASHCPGDSPFFVAAWYSTTIAFMAVVGGLAGRRLLRW